MGCKRPSIVTPAVKSAQSSWELAALVPSITSSSLHHSPPPPVSNQLTPLITPWAGHDCFLSFFLLASVAPCLPLSSPHSGAFFADPESFIRCTSAEEIRRHKRRYVPALSCMSRDGVRRLLYFQNEGFTRVSALEWNTTAGGWLSMLHLVSAISSSGVHLRQTIRTFILIM